MLSVEQRFWAKVNKDGPIVQRDDTWPVNAPDPPGTPCWVWTASRNRHGYGKFWLNGRYVGAHTVMFGSIPPGLELDHLCRNRACVYQSHLQAVTKAVNNLQGNGPAARHARKSACRCGRPYDFTYRDGRRGCRSCRTAASIRYRERKSA